MLVLNFQVNLECEKVKILTMNLYFTVTVDSQCLEYLGYITFDIW